MKELGIKHNIKNFVYEKEDLEKFSTHELVNFIRQIRNWHHTYFYPYYTIDDEYELKWKEYIDKYVLVREFWPDNCPIEYYWTDENVLRDILKTRPNIPNKIQRKRKLKKVINSNRKHIKRNLKYSR